jgi:hypothetical protein
MCKLWKTESRYREWRVLCFYLLRTPPPNFLGALSTLGGEPQAHTALVPRLSWRSSTRGAAGARFRSLDRRVGPFTARSGWTRSRVVKWGLSKECKRAHIQWHISECATVVLDGWAALAVTQLSGASPACYLIALHVMYSVFCGVLGCFVVPSASRLTLSFLSPIFYCVL